MPQVFFRGARRLIDADTGEEIQTQVVERSVGDAGFHKVWLHHILEIVDEVGNAKMQVLMWLLTHADTNNQIFATYDEIAAGSGVCARTVANLMRALKAANVITETRRTLWRLNPSVVFQGSHDRRMNVLIRYHDERGDLATRQSAAVPSTRRREADQPATPDQPVH